MSRKAIILSVHPRHAEGILDGTKTIELRRVRPKLRPGDHIVLYATLPTGRVVGFCRVESVIEADPPSLWAIANGGAQVTRPEFDSYYLGTDRAIGIVIGSPQRLLGPSLEEMRAKVPGFMPPQSYRYLAGLERVLQNLLRAELPKLGRASV